MKRYYKKWQGNILKVFGQLTLVLSLLLSANTWAILSQGSVVIDSVKLLDDGWVTLTVSDSTNLGFQCYGELEFQYAEGTLSEIYYAMLMTAKATGMQIKLGYSVGFALGSPCELNLVELYEDLPN